VKLSNIEKWQRRQAIERRKALDAYEMESAVAHAREVGRLIAPGLAAMHAAGYPEGEPAPEPSPPPEPPVVYHQYRALATPKWLTAAQRDEMRAMYRTAKAMSKKGHRYSVDHIVPLRGLRVCGLHVPWNLEITPLRENQSKNNRHHDGAPGTIRTCDLSVRSRVLYPAELRAPYGTASSIGPNSAPHHSGKLHRVSGS
jgi:hypothetical protein